jgi:hypothetical protein
MPGKPLHIVCLDAPAPPDYGGAIDMYYKILSLHAAGFDIRLHYFDYRKGRSAKGLEDFCQRIHAYKRKSFLATLFSGGPYIITSRNSAALVEALNKDDHPVLLEGIHCAGILPSLDRSRRIVLRMHNDEAAYYKRLAGSESSWWKKQYFKREARRLHTAQENLSKDIPLACVARNDMEVLQTKYGFRNLHFIPSFTSWQSIQSATGTGTYCLYQGNLEVAENGAAAKWLLAVFDGLGIPLWIAGKGASVLQPAAGPFVKIIADPDTATMEGLVRDAQLHVLPSMNSTGLKLKMLHALFCGRHCLTNTAGKAGTEFGDSVHVADTVEDFRKKVKELFQLPFTGNDSALRESVRQHYDNRLNAEKLKALLE